MPGSWPETQRVTGKECESEAACRVFAGELLHPRTVIDRSKSGHPVIITPGGAVCRTLYLCGVLTEFTLVDGDQGQGRIADPTGVVPLFMGRAEALACGECKALAPPVFVSCEGRIEVIGAGPGSTLRLRPSYVHAASRAVRDTWIVRTAQNTLARLQARLDQDGPPGGHQRAGPKSPSVPEEGTIRDLARMAISALEIVEKVAKISPQEISEADLPSEILAAIAEMSGPKGVAITDLTARFSRTGVREADLITVVRELIEADDLYQPQKGYVKIL